MNFVESPRSFCHKNIIYEKDAYEVCQDVVHNRQVQMKDTYGNRFHFVFSKQVFFFVLKNGFLVIEKQNKKQWLYLAGVFLDNRTFLVLIYYFYFFRQSTKPTINNKSIQPILTKINPTHYQHINTTERTTVTHQNPHLEEEERERVCACVFICEKYFF